MADYKQLRAAIDIRLSTDPEFRTIVKRINDGRATFIDTERYAQITARAVSRELSAEVLDLSDREGITTQILRDSYEDINSTCARVQKAMDEKAGIHIRPQQEDFPTERVQQFTHSLVDPTVEDSVTKRRARAGSDTIVKSAHDGFIRKNATFRNDAGLTCYIIREGSNCCKWCSDVAGKYKFGTQPDDIFRRHDNCDCTIIYDGQVLRGKQNADGSRSKTWEEVPNADSSYNPTVLSPEEAERLQAKNQPKILTNGVNGGTMGLRQGQDYSVAGLMFISHRDDLYQFAEKVPALPDFEDIVFHADRNSFLILNPDTGDIEKRLSPKNVADLLRNSNNYGGGDIRLLSCQSGYGGDNSLAQELANELNVKVLAPTEILAIDNTGKTFVSDNQLLIDMWGNGENVVETGQWITFKPGKEKG